MGDTAISWTDKTWNPVRGCSRVSAGCQRCYAERMAGRFSGPGQPYEGLVRIKTTIVNNEERDPGNRREPRWTGVVRMVPEHLADPIRWKKPCRVFVASMSDPFHEKLSDDDIDSIFAVMAIADWHQYQLLTKRPARMRRYVTDPDRAFKVLRAIDRLEVDLAMDGVDEEWRTVETYSAYDVSNFGRVRRGSKELALVDHGGGYKQVALCQGGVPKTHLVHRLILTAFDRAPQDLEEAAHRNGIRSDNRIANLRWATKDDNMQDAARQGTAGVWMKSRATLSPLEVADIRTARNRGEKLTTVAARFGISKQQVSAVALGSIFKPAPLTWPLPCLWLGVSVENQEAADERIPELLRTPAAVRFLSCEPLLSAVNLRRVQFSPMPIDALTGGWGVPGDDHRQDGRISWVIAGVESGPGARPCEVEWLRALRDQCAATDVPYFLKQATPARGSLAYGQPMPRPIDVGKGSKWKNGSVIELPYLDGIQHAHFPVVR